MLTWAIVALVLVLLAAPVDGMSFFDMSNEMI
jgi:uncharacterized membrane protein